MPPRSLIGKDFPGFKRTFLVQSHSHSTYPKSAPKGSANFSSIRFDSTFGDTSGRMAVLCSRCRGDAANKRVEVTCVMLEDNGCSACVERAAIRDKIERLEEEIIKLKVKYHALGTTMNAHHDPFIRKLPPEIGSHIFHFCLPTTDPARVSYYPQKDLLWVLKLGAVCRKWRQLAWATPNLWEKLSIVAFPERMRTLAGSWPGLINEWLGRSGGLPLSIFFFHDQNDMPDPEEFDGALEGIMDVLTLHSSRWRNLCLYVDPRTLERLFGPMHLNQLSRLELVVCDRHRRFSAHKIIMKSKPFPTYLRLESLSPTSIDIGWNNLTEANLCYLTTNDCAEVLRRAPALERFHVEIFRTPDRPMVHVGSCIIHPRIRSLNLSARGEDLLNMINVPTLEEWTQNASANTLPVTAMVSLLQRSSCCLKTLNLRQFTLRQNELVTLFHATPFLERLEMDLMDRSNAVNDILVRIFHSPQDPISPDESFLPHLQFMQCTPRNTRAAPFSWDRIPDLYRLGHRCSLTLKSVTNTSETSDETAMELLELVDEGANFLISDSLEGGDFLENFKKKRMGREDVETRMDINMTVDENFLRPNFS